MGLMSGVARGLSAAGYAGAELFGKAALDEQRAKLEEEKALRVADALEASKVAPMQRFSGLMSAKMNEQVPQEAEAVTKTTGEGAKAAGLQDGLVGMTREQVLAYKDPAMLAQYDKQMGEDKRLAEEKVAGKTRPRNQSEAIKAALNEALMNDPQAYVAGRTITAADKDDIEERKMASREKIEQARIEQRDRSDDKRFEAMMARIEVLGSKDGKSGGDKTALIQNAEYLKTLGYSDDKIEKFIFEKKEIPLEDMAAKILAGDKTMDMTPEQAAQKAIAVRKELDRLRDAKPTVQNDAPAEGTRLRKGGQMYVVKNGMPVLESEAARTSGGKIK
jgi:hypothetical protein